MKLSISNIGWDINQDFMVYEWAKEYRYSGIEIAPTRIFPEEPYARLEEAQDWAKKLSNQYGFVVPSMQSIWYGRQEKLFGSGEERKILIDYTKRAIDFASVIGCKNLVFGCPRNRVIPDGAEPSTAIRFFKEVGDYAAEKGTAIGVEANPPIYNTNYINDTASALKLMEEVDSKGFLLNLDVGTMIQNNETVDILKGKVHYINHVHISEPGLKQIEERRVHRQLKNLLEEERYDGFVSIEMGKVDDINIIEGALSYVKGIFGS